MRASSRHDTQKKAEAAGSATRMTSSMPYYLSPGTSRMAQLSRYARDPVQLLIELYTQAILRPDVMQLPSLRNASHSWADTL